MLPIFTSLGTCQWSNLLRPGHIFCHASSLRTAIPPRGTPDRRSSRPGTCLETSDRRTEVKRSPSSLQRLLSCVGRTQPLGVDEKRFRVVLGRLVFVGGKSSSRTASQPRGNRHNAGTWGLVILPGMFVQALDWKHFRTPQRHAIYSDCPSDNVTMPFLARLYGPLGRHGPEPAKASTPTGVMVSYAPYPCHVIRQVTPRVKVYRKGHITNIYIPGVSVRTSDIGYNVQVPVLYGVRCIYILFIHITTYTIFSCAANMLHFTVTVHAKLGGISSESRQQSSASEACDAVATRNLHRA